MNYQSIFDQAPDALQDLRDSIDMAIETPPDFLSLLESHHRFIEDSIKVLTDVRAATADKQFHLARFAALMNMHGHAEEQTLYEALEASSRKDARLEGFGGQDEHDLAYQLLDELDIMDSQNGWSDEIEAKARTVATLVKNHIEEEETVMFKIARRVLERDTLASLGRDYTMKCRDFLMLELPPPPAYVPEGLRP